VGVKQVNADQTVSPNLVPMVDVIFLMLLFLMVGADMGQRELEEVKLPIAASVKPEKPTDDDPESGGSKRLTLNVYHDVPAPPGQTIHCTDYETAFLCANQDHWSIGIRGTDYREGNEAELKARLESEVQIDREKRGLPPPEPGKPRPPSELRVMIRADQAALYKFVQRAMNACGDVGIYKIEIGAASPME
jgi:biopolymer transport protein ExbD